jgi:hypothetical protein
LQIAKHLVITPFELGVIVEVTLGVGVKDPEGGEGVTVDVWVGVGVTVDVWVGVGLSSILSAQDTILTILHPIIRTPPILDKLVNS